MEGKKYETEIPWADPTKWKPGDWYPLPVGFFARDQKEYIIDGYSIFAQDEAQPQDIVSIVYGPFVFSQALEICEEHNGRKLIE